MRAIWSIAGIVLLASGASPPQPGVDAVTFAQAFRGGDADRYRNTQISGTGTSFHGTVTERVADGTTRRSLVVTLGAAPPNGPVVLLSTWEDFVAAERARTTLAVALSGPDLPAVPSEPVSIKFSGVYDGQVRTIMRVPQAAEPAADSRPCPGEQAPHPEVKASFYCAALLTGATASIVPR